MALPSSCAACAFFTASLCRRHAPSTTEEELQFVEWPKVAPAARCGSGALQEEGKPPLIVRCEVCIHWFQPGGQPIKPEYLRSHSREWWEHSGFCTRFAPSPSSEPDRKVFWKVTHAEDSCGDAEEALLE